MFVFWAPRSRPYDRELRDALAQVRAKECQLGELLAAVIAVTEQPAGVSELEQHRGGAEKRERALHKRLKRYERRVRRDPGVNELGSETVQRSTAQHLPEHLEVSYVLLHRLAERAGDRKTARMANDSRDASRKAAQTISQHLDKVSNFYVP